MKIRKGLLKPQAVPQKRYRLVPRSSKPDSAAPVVARSEIPAVPLAPAAVSEPRQPKVIVIKPTPKDVPGLARDRYGFDIPERRGSGQTGPTQSGWHMEPWEATIRPAREGDPQKVHVTSAAPPKGSRSYEIMRQTYEAGRQAAAQYRVKIDTMNMPLLWAFMRLNPDSEAGRDRIKQFVGLYAVEKLGFGERQGDGMELRPPELEIVRGKVAQYQRMVRDLQKQHNITPG